MFQPGRAGEKEKKNEREKKKREKKSVKGKNVCAFLENKIHRADGPWAQCQNRSEM